MGLCKWPSSTDSKQMASGFWSKDCFFDHSTIHNYTAIFPYIEDLQRLYIISVCVFCVQLYVGMVVCFCIQRQSSLTHLFINGAYKYFRFYIPVDIYISDQYNYTNTLTSTEH